MFSHEDRMLPKPADFMRIWVVQKDEVLDQFYIFEGVVEKQI